MQRPALPTCLPDRILVPITSLLVLAAYTAAAADDPFRFRMVECPEGYFRCEVPDDWQLIRDRREEARTHYHGVYFFPAAEKEIRPTLSVRYFAPDNTYFASAEAYINRQTKPGIITLRDETVSAVRECVVDGRPASAFTRHSVDFYPPESIDTERIPVRSEYLVIPHRTGFVVVLFSAPTASFARWEPVYRHLLATLELSPRNFSLRVEAQIPLMNAEETEAQITIPIESELRRRPGIKEFCSRTTAEGSHTIVFLERGVEVEAERKRILEDLPRRLSPQCRLGSKVEADRDVLLLGLWSGDGARPRIEVAGELSTYARRAIVDRLKSIPGVAAVEVASGITVEVEILPDSDRLQREHLPLEQLAEAVRRYAAQQPSVLDGLRQVVCGDRGGHPVRLSDLAEIRVWSETQAENILWIRDDQTGTMRHPPAAILAVRAQVTADSAAVFRAVDQLAEELRAHLPDGCHLMTQSSTDARVWVRWRSSELRDDGDERARREFIVDRVAEDREIESIWVTSVIGASHPLSPWRVGDLCLGVTSNEDERLKAVTDRTRSLFGDTALVDRGTPAPANGTSFLIDAGLVGAIIRGPDRIRIADIAEALSSELRDTEGAGKLTILPSSTEPHLSFRIDQERAARFGLKPRDIRRMISLLREGRPLGTIEMPGGRRVDIMLKAGPDRADDPDLWERIPLETPEGMSLRLGEVVDIERSAGPQNLLRVSGQPAMLLGRTANTDRDRLLIDWQRAVARVRIPAGFAVSLEGFNSPATPSP